VRIKTLGAGAQRAMKRLREHVEASGPVRAPETLTRQVKRAVARQADKEAVKEVNGHNKRLRLAGAR
jgi:hypothetical protein